MLYDLWQTLQQPDYISSDKTEYLQSRGFTMTEADEKDAVALFKIFLRKKLMDNADKNYCHLGSISSPALFRIFLVQRGWESYYGTPEGKR